MEKRVIDKITIDEKSFSVVLDRSEDDFVSGILFVHSTVLMSEPRLHFHTFEDNLGSREIYLIDMFSAISENKGVGSKLLSYLFDFAEQEGYSVIKGSIFPDESTSLKKLQYFYRKNGFEVDEYLIEKKFKSSQ